MVVPYKTMMDAARSDWKVILPIPPFCRDCRWFSINNVECTRPGREIFDMISGSAMLTGIVVFLAIVDRTCVHPGACGREARFFEPKP